MGPVQIIMQSISFNWVEKKKTNNHIIQSIVEEEKKNSFKVRPDDLEKSGQFVYGITEVHQIIERCQPKVLLQVCEVKLWSLWKRKIKMEITHVRQGIDRERERKRESRLTTSISQSVCHHRLR